MFNKKFVFISVVMSLLCSLSAQDLDLNPEFSRDQFQLGVRAFHATRYESAYMYFTKAISFDETNNDARYFLGESYRKAGYEQNALFEWNSLLLRGTQSRELKNKISLLYNQRGQIDEVFLNQYYLLRDDIKGYYDKNVPPLFIKPTQVAIDNNDHYYISSFWDGKIVVLDANMHHVKSLLSTITGVNRPYGIALNSKGEIFVSDYEKDEVVVLDSNGFVKNKIGYKGLGAGGLLGPKNLAIDDEDCLYVSDSANKRINKYSESGQFLFSFGQNIPSSTAMISPCGLYYEKDKIYVCDRDADCILIFDKSGNYIDRIANDSLKKPVDIVRDSFGRLLILTEKKLWAYQDDASVWYVVDALGTRLEKAACIAVDRDRNIIVTDFNSSRFFVLSLESSRYTNLHINVERVFADSYPTVHLAVKVLNNDLSVPVGLDNTNFNVYENGQRARVVGSLNTARRDEIDDIIIVLDCKESMKSYIPDFTKILDTWLKDKLPTTNVSLIFANEDNNTVVSDFNTGRLTTLETLSDVEYSKWTDLGYAVKNAAYSMMSRFSRKAIILVTDGFNTKDDFNKFKSDDVVALLANNDITLNVVSFKEGPRSDLLSYMADKTGGLYYQAYKTPNLKLMINSLEKTRGNEVILTYQSQAVSRFNEEPIKLFLEVSYNGTNGTTNSLYFPPKL